MFYLPAATQLWRRKIAAIAKDFKEIRFAVANDESNEDLLKDFGLEDSSEEINIGIIANKKKYPMEPMEEFDSDHIRDFLASFRRGENDHQLPHRSSSKGICNTHGRLEAESLIESHALVLSEAWHYMVDAWSGISTLN